MEGTPPFCRVKGGLRARRIYPESARYRPRSALGPPEPKPALPKARIPRVKSAWSFLIPISAEQKRFFTDAVHVRLFRSGNSRPALGIMTTPGFPSPSV